MVQIKRNTIRIILLLHFSFSIFFIVLLVLFSLSLSFKKALISKNFSSLLEFALHVKCILRTIAKIDNIILILLDAASRPSVKNLLLKGKYFEHFHHVYSLVRDCKTRIEKLLKNNGPAYQMPEDVIVKIGIVGHHTKDNVYLISKRPGSIYSHI